MSVSQQTKLYKRLCLLKTMFAQRYIDDGALIVYAGKALSLWQA